MEMNEKNCVDGKEHVESVEPPNSTESKENNSFNKKLSNSNSNKSLSGNSLTLIAPSNSSTMDGVIEDCEMKNLDDYEPESSNLTTPISSSDLEQTPRSSSEVEGGDGEKSDKNDMPSNSVSKCTSSNNVATTNGPAHHVIPNLTKRNVTLPMLLAAGILKPGVGTMSLEYHGQKFVGDLLENGIIRSQETSQEFSSPSAWATACKQIINPDKNQRKSGCGWAAIKHRNLKLDYYKTVWFKRLREGSIDLKHISNGATSSSSDSEDEDTQVCVLKFGEHLEKSPSLHSAEQVGAKVLISCTDFNTIDRLQPFHVKISEEALALIDLHCNMISAECMGYVSGHWNSDLNCLKVETAHPCRILMPHSSSVECDMERNKIALDIQKLGHDVVGWYHSHPKAPPHPSKDDVARQLDYQVMMKGASESSYIPCIGIINSPMCYTSFGTSKSSPMQLFWVIPPPENRPLEMGRPMNIQYETFAEGDSTSSKMLSDMTPVLNFYKEKKQVVDLNDLASGKFEKLKETLCAVMPPLKENTGFWNDLRQLFLSPASDCLDRLSVKPESCQTPNAPTNSDELSGIALNHEVPAVSVVADSSPHSPSQTRDESSPSSLKDKYAPNSDSNTNAANVALENHCSSAEPEPMEVT